ncbi:hypothetical protein OG372_17365 [Streptomyces sp. NBC_01020]|uniref:hypothetical protein n=1 Tax=Streptomyces sp. NBC_01020 TaxID=2903722 RepID=UPI0038666738|nr:hypothetical protein OG372_17365 [Streptomyces sp. NBC_01020]
MQYEAPRRITAEEAGQAFQTGQPYEISEALIAAALHVPDRIWVEQWLVHFAGHPIPDVRRAAALALGHLARLHKQVSPQAISAIRNLLDDGELVGAATDALEDVEIFTKLN